MDEELKQALLGMAEVLGDGMFAMQVGPTMTCREAERLADVLRVAGFDHEADAWIEGHALEDQEGDLHYDEDE